MWRYEVDPERVEAFERAYGSSGGWVALFTRGEGYLGTELLLDVGRPGHYLTVDRWSSRSAYERFLTEHREAYEALDSVNDGLARSEVQIGSFETLAPRAT
ncbi:MAG: antibiotic biosynthesis monooxygenase family protein [Actinomycetota bacterium]